MLPAQVSIPEIFRQGMISESITVRKYFWDNTYENVWRVSEQPKAVHENAKRLGIDMPIVNEILSGSL